MQHLPPNVRMMLAFADATMDLCKLADMEDKVMEITTPTTQLSVTLPLIPLESSNSVKKSHTFLTLYHPCPLNLVIEVHL